MADVNLLRVWITLPSGETTELGELAFGEPLPNGTAPTAFRYARSWLERADAFPINPDPQTLPLVPTDFQGSQLGPPLQAFDDALPDDWGRRLIIAEHRLPMAQQRPFWLMRAVGGNGIGALSFSEAKRSPVRTRASRAIAELAAAAIAFDANETIDDMELRRLFAAGASPGGARPKAIVASDGHEWIAKFPSRRLDNGFDVVGLETTCLALATLAGLNAPVTRLVDLGTRRALLVRRFDITPAGGRVHMLSLKTLCGETGHFLCHSYDDPAAAIRKFSDDPDDLARFFRQMVFNAAIGNTDDHLKNFAMIRDAQGYRLSPAFDLVPNVAQNAEHVLAMGYQRTTPTGAELVQLGQSQKWLGDGALARNIIEEVVVAVQSFRATARDLAVAPDSIERIAADIDRRLARLSSFQASPAVRN